MARTRTLVHVCTLAILVSAAARPAVAATLQGRVLDPQRQAVANVPVRALQQGNELRRETTTDASGAFTLAELPPGDYALTAEAPGFAPYTRRGLTLAIGQTYRVDVALQIGGVAESVEATADAPLLTAGASTVDGVIGRSAIEGLPLNGRNFLELAFLVPGQRAHAQLRSDQDQQRDRRARRASSAAEA